MFWLKIFGHGIGILLATLLTQIGGLAWIIALMFRRRLFAFFLIYVGLWSATLVVAPHFGRVPLPCYGETLRAQSLFYCATARHYVSPDLAEVAQDAADEMAQRYPGTVTLYLDANLPFWDGFPLLPHLSHDDGEKLDLAFYYTDELGAYLPGKTRSLIGYWAFEALDKHICPEKWPTLRWDFAWLQPLWAKRPLEAVRTGALVQILAADPRIAKLFLEPPMAESLSLNGQKLRFQGCRAARHDDHLHIQL